MGEVVVGVDGSAHAAAAAAWAAAEARRRGATLRLAHAYVPHSSQYPFSAVDPEALSGLDAADRAQGDDLVGSLATRLRDDHAVRVVPEVVEGDPARTLIDRSTAAEVLVVGSRGTGGLRGLVLGSVSQKCVQHARCPVVVVPPQATDGPVSARRPHPDGS